MVFCGECGSRNEDEARFCEDCGAQIEQDEPAPVQKPAPKPKPARPEPKPLVDRPRAVERERPPPVPLVDKPAAEPPAPIFRAKPAVPAGPPPEGVNNGSYLTFSESSGGSMWTQWSEEPIEEAWAFFTSAKPVPKFKYGAGGRKELNRGVGGAGKGRIAMMQGWCVFVKEAKTYGGRLMILNSEQVAVFVLTGKNDVIRVKRGEWLEADVLANIAAVAVVGPDFMSFNVQTMAPRLFIETGLEAGFATAVQ